MKIDDRSQKLALIYVYLGTQFVELHRVAKMLVQSGRYTPVIYFNKSYSNIERDYDICHNDGIKCLDPSGKTVDTKSAEPLPNHEPNYLLLDIRSLIWKYKRHLPQPIKRIIITLYSFHRSSLISLPDYWLSYRNTFCLTKSIFDRHQPDIVVLAEDNAGNRTAIPIREAHKRGIPVVLTPYTMANALEPVEALYNDFSYWCARPFNRLMAKRYPHWVYEHKGRELLRLRGPEIFVVEHHRLAPPLPWILNSGYADAIAVESECMAEYYQRAGLPSEKMVLTGALYDDVLAENRKHLAQRKSSLYRATGLPSSKPLILCALPPELSSRLGSDFRDYSDLIRFWVSTLAESDTHNIIVRPHPAIKMEEIEPLFPPGINISYQDTASLVPLCDIYIASVSATIRWAIACGTPVINYDIYRLGYQDYSEVKGVLTVNEKDDFVKTLHRLTHDHAYYRVIKAHQARESKRWGRLDGQAASRMLELFDRLTSQPPVKKRQITVLNKQVNVR